MIHIQVTNNQGQSNSQVTEVRTEGYVLLFLVGDRIQFKGDVSLASIAPYFMKFLAQKFTGGIPGTQ